jgi:hypothetical protein
MFAAVIPRLAIVEISDGLAAASAANVPLVLVVVNALEVGANRPTVGILLVAKVDTPREAFPTVRAADATPSAPRSTVLAILVTCGAARTAVFATDENNEPHPPPSLSALDLRPLPLLGSVSRNNLRIAFASYAISYI